jgi:hypothetical protein
MQKYNLNIRFSEVICDFIKDVDGKLWFLQLKGFKLTEESMKRTHIWNDIRIGNL